MHRHTLYACIYPTTHKTAKKVGTGGGGLHICIYTEVYNIFVSITYIYIYIYIHTHGDIRVCFQELTYLSFLSDGLSSVSIPRAHESWKPTGV